AEGVELLAIGLDILDPGLDGLEAGKLVNDQAIGVGRLAEVDPELLAVAQGDALAAVALHRPHDLGYDLAMVGLRVVDGGVNDHIDGHARCLLVSDPDWPAMYRVRRPDGTPTDMVNLTRVRDAAQHFGRIARGGPHETAPLSTPRHRMAHSARHCRP